MRRAIGVTPRHLRRRVHEALGENDEARHAYEHAIALANLVELTGRLWENKVVGFLCSAGGPGSYMSIMGLANSLMLDYAPDFAKLHRWGSDFFGRPILSKT